MLALERPGNGFQARLLPSATGLPVLEHFIAANHAGGIKFERFSFCPGPEHEGRIAVGSPGDRDRSCREIVENHTMLRKNGRRVRFHDIAAGKAYQTIAIGQKRGGGSRGEFRIVYRGVRHSLGRLKSEQRQCHKVKRDAGSHGRYYLTALGIV